VEAAGWNWAKLRIETADSCRLVFRFGADLDSDVSVLPLLSQPLRSEEFIRSGGYFGADLLHWHGLYLLRHRKTEGGNPANHRAMNIHIQRGGQMYGPYTLEQTRAYLKDGRLAPNDQAWYEGSVVWSPLAAIRELGLDVPAQPPPPPAPPPTFPAGDTVANAPPGTAISHSLVWVSAFVPLFGLVVDSVLREFGLTTWIGTGIVIAINIALLTKDETQLRKQGINTAGLGSAWLVPVYLFKRVQLVGGGYGYAVCWMITFFLSILQ